MEPRRRRPGPGRPPALPSADLRSRHQAHAASPRADNCHRLPPGVAVVDAAGPTFYARPATLPAHPPLPQHYAGGPLAARARRPWRESTVTESTRVWTGWIGIAAALGRLRVPGSAPIRAPRNYTSIGDRRHAGNLLRLSRSSRQGCGKGAVVAHLGIADRGGLSSTTVSSRGECRHRELGSYSYAALRPLGQSTSTRSGDCASASGRLINPGTRAVDFVHGHARFRRRTCRPWTRRAVRLPGRQYRAMDVGRARVASGTQRLVAYVISYQGDGALTALPLSDGIRPATPRADRSNCATTVTASRSTTGVPSAHAAASLCRRSVVGVGAGTMTRSSSAPSATPERSGKFRRRALCRACRLAARAV